jgi:hypothetical protein
VAAGIIDYRARKIGESIMRVQSKIGTQGDLAATSEPPAYSCRIAVAPEEPWAG